MSYTTIYNVPRMLNLRFKLLIGGTITCKKNYKILVVDDDALVYVHC